MSVRIWHQFQRLIRKSSSQGFSFPDLLAGGSLTLAMIAIGGYGITQMFDISTTANATSERRIEQKRSLSFMERETYIAQEIIQDASDDGLVPAEFDPNATGVSNVERVLMLQIAGLPQPVIYYLAEPVDDTWLGPKVSYRWGPNYDGNGNYTNAETPNTWTYEPLIDRIEDNGPIPNCATGWTGNGAAGFYVCVDPSGKLAQVHQAGRINRLRKPNETYAASTYLRVRSSDVIGSTYAPPPGALFNLNGGTITFGAPATMRIEFMGGAITCGPTGPDIPTSATLNFSLNNETTSENVPSSAAVYEYTDIAANTSLTIDGIADGDANSGDCDGHYMEANSASDTVQVIALEDGDTAPSYVPFGNQQALDGYLASILDENGEVSLAPNEVVYLYELGVTDQSSDAFDMQDIVVRATITPTPGS